VRPLLGIIGTLLKLKHRAALKSSLYGFSASGAGLNGLQTAWRGLLVIFSALSYNEQRLKDYRLDGQADQNMKTVA
jgi:hypothetical protein